MKSDHLTSNAPTAIVIAPAPAKSSGTARRRKVCFDLKQYRIDDEHHDEQQTPTTPQEIKTMWYTCKDFKQFKARAKKTKTNDKDVARYERALRDTYAACRSSVLLNDDSDSDCESTCSDSTMQEFQIIKTPVPLHELDNLSQAMSQISPRSRLGLEKNTVDRMSGGQKQLLAGIQNLQGLNKPNCAQQIASLAQQTSRPACLFAHTLALAVERDILQDAADSSIEEDGMSSGGSSHSTRSLSRTLSRSASRLLKRSMSLRASSGPASKLQS